MIRPYCWRDLASRAEARRTGPGILAAVNNSPGPSRIAPYGRYATRFQVLRVAALRGERERERELHLNASLTRLAPRIVTRDRARLRILVKINCGYKDREEASLPIESHCSSLSLPCAFISVTMAREQTEEGEGRRAVNARQRRSVLDSAADCSSALFGRREITL